ncbi:hypothetical protein LTR10_015933 [Elasticomyces elasticus]|nr:hypothetical protein LTR10_015933 [Elasticomyces elasticus]
MAKKQRRDFTRSLVQSVRVVLTANGIQSPRDGTPVSVCNCRPAKRIDAYLAIDFGLCFNAVEHSKIFVSIADKNGSMEKALSNVLQNNIQGCTLPSAGTEVPV